MHVDAIWLNFIDVKHLRQTTQNDIIGGFSSSFLETCIRTFRITEGVYATSSQEAIDDKLESGWGSACIDQK